MTVYGVFHHFSKLYKKIAESSGFFIDHQIGLLIASSIDDNAFNMLELEKLDATIFTELKNKINVPFLCLPGKNMDIVNFEKFMEEHQMIKSDMPSAQVYNNLQMFKNEIYIPNLRIRLVENFYDLMCFDALSSISFNHKPGNFINFMQGFSASNYKVENLYLFLAEIGDIPVGTSMLATHDNIAGLYWDSVHPDYRKQGIGSAMIYKRMEFARELSHSKIIVQAETPSINLYQKLGFTPLGSLPVFVSQVGVAS